ncbi:NuA4-domain-containing protein [Vararia minispora EC-137]|uniref:NuA4-domain-containing protein n=1 Tax=Vararia minispora EC-137 TaxID=1314806 RepID=A0ACB8QGU1_9AGAM|nr:NuA4-domain-containing protein [Vararia minispora EC-137]
MATEETQPSSEDKARYQSAKKDLIAAIARKRILDKQLAQLEVNIYNLEGSYLSDTSSHSGGNIIHGFDGYLKNQVIKKRYEPSEADRLFSGSSTTYMKARVFLSLELSGEGEESAAATDDYRQSNGITTVLLPPPSRPQEISAAQAKKNRDREYQRRKRAAASRRSVGTASDDERRPQKKARLGEE